MASYHPLLPDSTWLPLGHALRRANDMAGAIRAYREAAQISREAGSYLSLINALNSLVISLTEMGQAGEALATLERARWGKNQRLMARYWPSSWFVQAFRYLSYTATFGGFLALFWDYQTVIGLIFLLMSALAFGIALVAEQAKSTQIYPELPRTESGQQLAAGIDREAD